jgi:hypothetical protein
MNHLEVTGVDWVDFVSYSSEFPDYAQLFIYRLARVDYIGDIERIRIRRGQFIEMVDSAMAEIEGMK